MVRIEYPGNVKYELNITSNTTIQWLKIRLQFTILNGVMMSSRDAASSCGQNHRHHGHTCRSICLHSNLTMKTSSYSRQASPDISYVHTHTHKVTKLFTFMPKIYICHILSLAIFEDIIIYTIYHIWNYILYFF